MCCQCVRSSTKFNCFVHKKIPITLRNDHNIIMNTNIKSNNRKEPILFSTFGIKSQESWRTSKCLTSFYIFIEFAAKTFLVLRHSHYARAIIIFISDPNSNSQSDRIYKYHHTDEHVSIIMRRHDRDLFGIPSCSRFPDRNNAMRTL